MKIYLDYVFFINFLFDLILLFGISFLLKRNTKLFRILLGSLFGGVTTFLLFLNISNSLFFILKIILGIIMLIITFNYKNIKYTIQNLIYLMILSIVAGGLLYLINIEVGYEHVGLIFFTNGKSLNIFILIVIALLTIFIYIKINLKYKKEINLYYRVDIYQNNKVIKLNGYLDTGNNLSYLNKPIYIINKNIKIKSNKKIYVPFSTINGTSLMTCYVIEKIYIHKIGYRNNVLVGTSLDKLSLSGVDIILPKEVL